MISVAIVEDDHEIRESLAVIIDGTPGYRCGGIYPDAESALSNLEQAMPDVILMDITLPGMSGVECVQRVKAEFPAIDIIMLTVHEEDTLVFQSLCAGACGYLIKNTSPAKLLDAIREVHDGGAPMSTRIARMVVSSFKKNSSVQMTGRETDVLHLLVKGMSYKMIADALFVSQDTIRTHIKNIYRKLEVNSKSEAVAKALTENLVPR